jgi:alpha-glucosidase
MKVAAILLLTLRGTPIMYYGDEIGIPQVHIPDDEVQDPQGLLMPGKNLSRDPQRTPMQWDKSRNAGFSKGDPWLRLSDDYEAENVDLEQKDDQSLLWFYKRLIALRQSEPSFTIGEYQPVYADSNILSYSRIAPGCSQFLIVLNLTNKPTEFSHPFSFQGQVQLHTDPELEGTEVSQSFSLPANAGCIIRMVE